MNGKEYAKKGKKGGQRYYKREEDTRKTSWKFFLVGSEKERRLRKRKRRNPSALAAQGNRDCEEKTWKRITLKKGGTGRDFKRLFKGGGIYELHA